MEFGDRHDAADQPGALGLHGIHAPARQAKLHRLGLADGTGQPLRAAGAGHDAEIDLGLAEHGIVAGEMMSQDMASSQPPPSA